MLLVLSYNMQVAFLYVYNRKMVPGDYAPNFSLKRSSSIDNITTDFFMDSHHFNLIFHRKEELGLKSVVWSYFRLCICSHI